MHPVERGFCTILDCPDGAKMEFHKGIGLENTLSRIFRDPYARRLDTAPKTKVILPLLQFYSTLPLFELYPN